jgi:hypothetical protein
MLEELLTAWLVDLEREDRAPKTVIRYRGVIYRFLSWHQQAGKLGGTNLLDFIFSQAFAEAREQMPP